MEGFYQLTKVLCGQNILNYICSLCLAVASPTCKPVHVHLLWYQCIAMSLYVIIMPMYTGCEWRRVMSCALAMMQFHSIYICIFGVSWRTFSTLPASCTLIYISQYCMWHNKMNLHKRAYVHVTPTHDTKYHFCLKDVFIIFVLCSFLQEFPVVNLASPVMAVWTPVQAPPLVM